MLSAKRFLSTKAMPTAQTPMPTTPASSQRLTPSPKYSNLRNTAHPDWTSTRSTGIRLDGERPATALPHRLQPVFEHLGDKLGIRLPSSDFHYLPDQELHGHFFAR